MIDPPLVFLSLSKTLIFLLLDRIRVSLGITLILSWHQGWWCLRWWCHALRPSQGTYCTCIQRREEKRNVSCLVIFRFIWFEETWRRWFLPSASTAALAARGTPAVAAAARHLLNSSVESWELLLLWLERWWRRRTPIYSTSWGEFGQFTVTVASTTSSSF